MSYTYSITFDKDEDTIFIKDSTNHFGIREIYGINTPTEELKEKIIPYINLVIDYYKELCNIQDEAN